MDVLLLLALSSSPPPLSCPLLLPAPSPCVRLCCASIFRLTLTTAFRSDRTAQPLSSVLTSLYSTGEGVWLQKITLHSLFYEDDKM